jgi:hypothetical protein
MKIRKDKMPRAVELSRARCAGMVAATAGRGRSFADKRDLLPGILAAACDSEISDGLAEWAERRGK